MLTYEQALQRILQETPSPRNAAVGLKEALGLATAQPIMARIDLPRFDNTAVDGYALSSRDGRGLARHFPRLAAGAAKNVRDGGPTALRVVGQSSAGTPFPNRLRPGQAVRVFTGGVVPRGTECVVMQEEVQREGERLLVQRWPAPGQNIRRRAEDLRRGTRVLEKGTLLRPQEIGLLAALGFRKVRVYSRPTVAILVTGDEVKPPGPPLKAGEIYESNGALLRALVQQAGARAVNLGITPDLLQRLVARIRTGIVYDLLLISGGVSVGEKDLVRQAARSCGVKELLWKVNIKPGMPLFVGRKGRTLLFGLPGNPVSVYVTFEEFVKPALFQLMGRPWHDQYLSPAILTQDLKISTTRRTHFVRVRSAPLNGRILAEPTGGQGSHQLGSLAQSNGWVRVISNQGPWPAGTSVLVKLESMQSES